MITVLIVDDHPIYRDGLLAVLEPRNDIRVVGQAEDGETAIALGDELRPDVILMDLAMPGLGGVAATRTITERHPNTAVLILTMSEASDSIWAAMRAGARGYLVKGSTGPEITNAIHAAHQGSLVFGPAIAETLHRIFDSSPGAPSPFPDLTDREVEVLRLIAARRTNAEIADRLYLSDKTVRNHVSNIFTKLQVRSRREAIERATTAGLNENSPHQ